MLVKVEVEEAGAGLHPNQMLIKIQTIDGPQIVAVDRRSVRQNMIEVGYPISQHGRYRLIELPAETSGGAWRVWVDENTTSEMEVTE